VLETLRWLRHPSRPVALLWLGVCSVLDTLRWLRHPNRPVGLLLLGVGSALETLRVLSEPQPLLVLRLEIEGVLRAVAGLCGEVAFRNFAGGGVLCSAGSVCGPSPKTRGCAAACLSACDAAAPRPLGAGSCPARRSAKRADFCCIVLGVGSDSLLNTSGIESLRDNGGVVRPSCRGRHGLLRAMGGVAWPSCAGRHGLLGLLVRGKDRNNFLRSDSIWAPRSSGDSVSREQAFLGEESGANSLTGASFQPIPELSVTRR